MSIDTSMVNQVNQISQANQNVSISDMAVTKKDSSSVEEKEKQIGHANNQVILAEFVSAMALFRLITEIMWQFQEVARDNAMKTDQLYNAADFKQVQAAFNEKVDSLNAKLSVSRWSAGTQIFVGAVSAGVGFSMKESASAVATILDNTVNGGMSWWNASPQTEAEINGQEADVQHHQSRFYTEIHQRSSEWHSKMSQMMGETNSAAIQVYQQLSRTFSTSFQ